MLLVQLCDDGEKWKEYVKRYLSLLVALLDDDGDQYFGVCCILFGSVTRSDKFILLDR
jgi:hypothetical protein